MQTKITFKNQNKEQGKSFTRENIEIGQWYLIDGESLVLGIKSIGKSDVIAIDADGDLWIEDLWTEYTIKPVEVEIIVNN